ncbi:ATP-dependent clp protease proteolytic subunit-related protein 4 [Citrus sinensis]|nr:ATP-dependent clp protease proteolytic subunit-related protein 4 [Citrus sinensis]
MVIPFTSGTAWEQPPPDLASYLYKNRIVYLGMSFVPSVRELILAEFLYLQYEDAEKPIYLYLNSTGTTEGGEKLSYETEAFAIYDVMGKIKVHMLQATLLLGAGAKGNCAALPSSTIMIKRIEGQAINVEIARKEIKNVKAELVKIDHISNYCEINPYDYWIDHTLRPNSNLKTQESNLSYPRTTIRSKNTTQRTKNTQELEWFSTFEGAYIHWRKQLREQLY